MDCQLFNSFWSGSSCVSSKNDSHRNQRRQKSEPVRKDDASSKQFTKLVRKPRFMNIYYLISLTSGVSERVCKSQIPFIMKSLGVMRVIIFKAAEPSGSWNFIIDQRACPICADFHWVCTMLFVCAHTLCVLVWGVNILGSISRARVSGSASSSTYTKSVISVRFLKKGVAK
jgi:hypothetical protein